MTPSWQLKNLLAGIVNAYPATDCQITSLALDSRQVQVGALFFAYRGSCDDGKRFIPEAIERGAVAILVDQPVVADCAVPVIVVADLVKKIGEIAARFYQQPSRQLTVIGVTGTNGKSSVCYFLAQALRQLGKKSGVMTTVGRGILPDLTPVALTTMDAITLQRTLAQFVAQQVEVVVLEVSSHALDQQRVAAIEFDYAVLTNISREHLDYHPTMEHYANCKQQLFHWPTLRGVVLNDDDAYGRAWQSQLPASLPCQRYAMQHTTADFYCAQLSLTAAGIEATVVNHQQCGPLSTGLLGQFNVANLLAVIATLRLMGFALTDSLSALATLQAPPGRMQLCRASGQPLVVIDYAHTADALIQALTALRPVCRGRLICVFGCGGDRDRGKRPQMAAAVEQYADWAIVTDDNPRYEPSAKIIAEILTGFQQHNTVQVEADRRAAIALAITQAHADDIILLAGKGHEPYQEINGQSVSFDEQAIVQNSFIENMPTTSDEIS